MGLVICTKSCKSNHISLALINCTVWIQRDLIKSGHVWTWVSANGIILFEFLRKISKESEHVLEVFGSFPLFRISFPRTISLSTQNVLEALQYSNLECFCSGRGSKLSKSTTFSRSEKFWLLFGETTAVLIWLLFFFLNSNVSFIIIAIRIWHKLRKNIFVFVSFYEKITPRCCLHIHSTSRTIFLEAIRNSYFLGMILSFLYSNK